MFLPYFPGESIGHIGHLLQCYPRIFPPGADEFDQPENTSPDETPASAGSSSYTSAPQRRQIRIPAWHAQTISLPASVKKQRQAKLVTFLLVSEFFHKLVCNLGYGRSFDCITPVNFGKVFELRRHVGLELYTASKHISFL